VPWSSQNLLQPNFEDNKGKVGAKMWRAKSYRLPMLSTKLHGINQDLKSCQVVPVCCLGSSYFCCCLILCKSLRSQLIRWGRHSTEPRQCGGSRPWLDLAWHLRDIFSVAQR